MGNDFFFRRGGGSFQKSSLVSMDVLQGTGFAFRAVFAVSPSEAEALRSGRCENEEGLTRPPGGTRTLGMG